MSMTTWRKLIGENLKENGESWEDVIHLTLNDQHLDEVFDCSFGLKEGKSFTLWTHKRVYFPACYDGAEWVESVPRHPSSEVTSHVGG